MSHSANCNYCKKDGESVALLTCSCTEVFYCNKSCQKSDWKQHKSLCPPFRVFGTDGKGNGMMATRRIPRYSVILEEDPVLVKEPSNNNGDSKLWEDFQNSMTVELRGSILKLYDPKDGEDDTTKISNPNKLKRIMGVNSIKYTNNLTNKTTQNLYLRISRINHSCNPNCGWKPDINSHRCAVVSLVEIEKNQEITVNYYYNLADPRGEFCLGYQQRQQKLNNLFSFRCLCQVCQQEGEDDQLRSEYRNMDQQLDQAVFAELNADALLKKAEMKLDLGKVLDNQVLLKDIVDCLILLRFNLDLCRDTSVILKLTQKMNQLQKEAHLAVRSYPDHFKNELENLNLI